MQKSSHYSLFQSHDGSLDYKTLHGFKNIIMIDNVTLKRNNSFICLS